MLFNSIEFALFLPIVLVLYWLLYRRAGRRAQNCLLLIASYVFYGAWDLRFLALIVLSTLIDYVVALILGQTIDDRWRRILVAVSVTSQLLILAFFKYFGFFLESALALFRILGLEPNPPLLEVLLPIGISFYTFQTLSYTLDVYRRRVAPERDFITFATFVAYFPHLVAGPIMRAHDLLPQLASSRRVPSQVAVRSALFLILLGLFKKVAIADAVAPVANEAFASPSTAGASTLWLGAVAFAFQIYCDFSGYSDIARGTSRLFGIELIRNFEQPYLSRNITEFWRTWHISLSNWLHDYLYVPLGGNRGTKLQTYRNLMLTMLLGGLWHGAAWTYVIWGGLHGAWLSLERAFGHYVRRGRPPRVTVRDIPSILLTFIGVLLIWVFFRAPSVEIAVDYLTGMFSFRSGNPTVDSLLLVGGAAAIVAVIDVAQRLTGDHAVVLRWQPALRGATYALLFLSIAVWTGGEAQPFIYFQF
jgi:alginate O-acetyltransferase complex protein AlgI